MVARYCTTGLTCQSPCVPGTCSIKPVRPYVRGGGRAPRPALIAIAARGPGPIRGGPPPHCLVRCITVLRSVALNHTLLRTANEADGDKICDTTPGRAKAGCGLCQRPSWHCRRLVEARPGAVPGTNGLEIPWRSDLENLRVTLDQPLEGGRANDQCSRNIHPSCRSYRVQERRSMPTRELGFYSCRSGSRTTRPPALPCNTTTNKLLHLILTF